MAYESFTFPSSDIDPRKKGKKYILQHVRAGYGTSKGTMASSLFFGKDRMVDIRRYAQGAQPTSKYKNILLPNPEDEESWQSINWDILPILTKFREIAVAKIYQQGIDIQATAIDPLSKSEEDDYFNQMKVKIMMREAAQKQGSQLAESPVLQANPNEPEDLEQLQIEQEYSYKHVMSMEAEIAIDMCQQNNDFQEQDKRLVESLVDFGIGGLTQWIDETGMVRERCIDPQRLILSYCNKPDFSDLVYWGEVVEVQLGEIAQHFSAPDMKEIVEKVKGQFGNPVIYDETEKNYFEKFKAYVLEYKFLDYNTNVYETRLDDNGNERFGKTDFGKLAHISVNAQGEIEDSPASVEAMNKVTQTLEAPKYSASTKQVVYKTKWIIDTDFMYDYGLSENMVRRKSKWRFTNLDIQLYAWNFEKMRFHGLTERLIPLADDFQLTWYKMQNLRNKLLPYIMNMDLDSFEGIAFGKGGHNMKPNEVVDFLFSNYIALYRSRDKFTNNPNYKPVTVEGTGQLNILAQMRDELIGTIDLMRQISGLNEITDGSAPNPKNLNSTNEAALMGTNNALWPIYNARKNIVLRSADNIILKQQIAVKLGKVEGMVRAMGSDSVKMYEINPDISTREFGIFVEDAPTDQERQELWQEISLKDSQGLLDISDKIIIKECRNLKQAAMVLAYRIKKRKEEQQQAELAKIQENNSGQQQMAAMSEQLKQQSIQLQLQADLAKIEAQMRWQYQIEAMSKQIDYDAQKVQSDARTLGHEIQADAKITASHIAAVGSIEKQHVSNKKPKTPATK